MPKQQILTIAYDNRNSQVFFPGQPVSGTVNLVLSEPLKMKRLILSISGKAHIYWTQWKNTSHQDVDDHSHTAYYTHDYNDTERYLKQEVVLYGNTDSTSELAAGSHQFTFSFILPGNCLSSFESKHCYIRYYCKAKVEVPWKIDYVTKVPFTVKSMVDLNLVSNMERPNRIEKTQQLYAFMIKTGTVHQEWYMPRRGFVPGETIPFEVKIMNNSSTVLSTVSVSLVRVVTVIAQNTHTHRSSNLVTSIKHCNIAPHGEHLWQNEGLKVPPVMPCLKSRILEISYLLVLKVNPKGLHLSDTLSIPVFIGNIPLRTTTPG